MIVKGTKTVVDHIEVSVDPTEFLRELRKKIMPSRLSYIGADGHWYREDECDYHRREDLYEKDRPATDEEIELKLAFGTLINYCKDKKL